jgi:uncharacterized membrane protein (DUF373 family)
MGADRDIPPREGAGVRRSEIAALQTGIGIAETAIYVAVAALLIVAVAFTLVGTVIDLIEGSDSRPIADSGVFLLDRVLLVFIIAELLYTLRVVNFGGRILVEPFLLIGLIAVVRKILVVAAEADRQGLSSGDVVTQIAALAGLALVLTISIYLLRRSMPPEPAPEAGVDGGPSA